jgi:hypothetical protein
MLAGRQPFQLSLQLADGSKVVGGRRARDAEPAGPFGGGTSRHTAMRWWAWPLPPAGPLDFICQIGTSGTRVSMNAQLILDASHQTVRVWPESGA